MPILILILAIAFVATQLLVDWNIKHLIRAKFIDATPQELLIYYQKLKNYRLKDSIINIKRNTNFKRTEVILYGILGFILGVLAVFAEGFDPQIFNALSCLGFLLLVLISLNHLVDQVSERNYFIDYLKRHPQNEMNVVLIPKSLLYFKTLVIISGLMVGTILLGVTFIRS